MMLIVAEWLSDFDRGFSVVRFVTLRCGLFLRP